ncbi:MAG TPA: hypothetical protein VH351_15135 [Bryobacteraceae bacterium]|nr:hypothetical protein [Bryobacteraceae bacterium]
MLIGYVGSSDTSATATNFNRSVNTHPADNPQSSQHDWGSLARFVSEYAFAPGASSTPATTSTAVSSTFGSNPKPPYDPNTPADFSSNDGRTAANGLLRIEQFEPVYNLEMQAQLMVQTLGQHKNDPRFLQQYLGALGASRVASNFSYLSSLANIQTPYNYSHGEASPQQLQQQYQKMADALSTLVKNKDFSQTDMDQFAGQFAKTNPQVNFFAKDVLRKASPRVNQMFFASAKNYALTYSGTKAGQSIAAYAMQALSQTTNPLPKLESLPANQLAPLLRAAMEGEAAYGNPPTIDEYAKTGVFRAQDGNGDPLNGLTSLMFNAAYSDVGDPFSPAPLSTRQAQDLQTKLFQAAIGTMQSNPAVRSFYTQSVPQGVSMKDALSLEFQQGYDSIVKAYSGRDGELNSAGMSAFREFFADAVFTPPPSSYALGAVQTIQNRLATYISQADKSSSGAQPSQQEAAYAESLGEQAQAMAAGLKEAFAGILNGASQSDENTQSLLDGIISVGGAVVGTVGGPAGGIGSATVGEALTLLVNSSSSSGPGDIQAAVSELKSHGLDVSGYRSGAFYDLSTNIGNTNFRAPFQTGLNAAATVLYNG